MDCVLPDRQYFRLVSVLHQFRDQSASTVGEETERFSEKLLRATTSCQTKLAKEISMDAAMAAVLRLKKNKQMALMAFLVCPTDQQEALNRRQQM